MPDPTPSPSPTHPSNSSKPAGSPAGGPPQAAPSRLDLAKDKGLTIAWGDGTVSFYPIGYLRRMSPSADMRQLREEMDKNPLTVLPSGGSSGPLVARTAELVGNYALRIEFSDGHSSGIYSWVYLRSIDPGAPKSE